MPYGYITLSELATLLGMDQRRVERMAQRDEIPCMKVGGELRFNRAEITEWLQQQMPQLTKSRLADMDTGITAHRQGDPNDSILIPLLREEAVSADLGARTKNSVIKELVALAQETDLVYDAEAILEALTRREELCSTAMEKGIAIPHPRRPLPYAVAEPILVIARTSQGIGFGAPDGRLTDLFFMTCSQDDHHHLHILARLCRVLNDDNIITNIRQASTPPEIIEIIRQQELQIMAESL